MKVKVDFTLKAIQRRGSNPRYELTVILKNIDSDQKTFGKNYSNIELSPAKSLEMGDYQLICNERGLSELMQNSKGIRIRNADAEIGIGTFSENGDKYYFVRTQLCDGLFRTCYLSESQIRNLKYVNLGYDFKETDDVESLKDIKAMTESNTDEKKDDF